MKTRPIRYRHLVAGIVILTITLWLAIYMPTSGSFGGGRTRTSLAVWVSIFGEFAGRYYFFLLPFLFGLYVVREAFRAPQERTDKP